MSTYLLLVWAGYAFSTTGYFSIQLNTGIDKVVKKPAESHPDSYAYTGSKYREVMLTHSEAKRWPPFNAEGGIMRWYET